MTAFGSTQSGQSPAARRILFCRVPGLLARAARAGKKMAVHAPLVVSEGKVVRDACLFSLGRGIYAGQSISQARRLCPTLLVVPLDTIDPRPLTTEALEVLADLSPVVEPCGPDAAYVDLMGVDLTGGTTDLQRLEARLRALTEFCPMLGLGPSRLAARACAECELPPERLAEAGVEWLWPEDGKVIGRLKRLGLETFGQVAALREEDLFYQFGKIGRLLHRRALGQDLMTVQPLYPPPRADFRLEFAEYALRDRAMLQAALATAAHEASGQLVALGQYGRRLVLRVETERGEMRRDWTLPVPLQETQALTRAASRLLMQMPLTAPVVSLRLLVEELERPKAATADLFAGRMHRDTLALDAARRVLAERYGPQVLVPLSQRPQTVREQRRALEDDRANEVWQ